MDDLLEFLLGFVVDGAMDAVDSPRVPLWARIGLGALLLAFLLGISFLVIWVGLRTGRWGLIVLGVLFLAGTAVLMVHKLRRRKKRESHQERPPVRTFRTGGFPACNGRGGMVCWPYQTPGTTPGDRRTACPLISRRSTGNSISRTMRRRS